MTDSTLHLPSSVDCIEQNRPELTVLALIKLLSAARWHLLYCLIAGCFCGLLLGLALGERLKSNISILPALPALTQEEFDRVLFSTPVFLNIKQDSQASTEPEWVIHKKTSVVSVYGASAESINRLIKGLPQRVEDEFKLELASKLALEKQALDMIPQESRFSSDISTEWALNYVTLSSALAANHRFTSVKISPPVSVMIPLGLIVALFGIMGLVASFCVVLLRDTQNQQTS